MTKEIYNQTLIDLQKKYQDDRNSVMREYALANNPYTIGDIVTDHMGSLKIKNIKICFSTDTPQCIYFGTELKKDLTPIKRQSNRAVYQSNVIPHKCYVSEVGSVSEEAFNNLQACEIPKRIKIESVITVPC